MRSFGDRIVVDGLLTSRNVSLGPGIRRSLLDQYRDITERDALRTTLLPTSNALPSWEKRVAMNKKVLQAFERYLRGKRLSLKVVQRNVEAIGTLERVTTEEGRALHDATIPDIERALQVLAAADLKRFIQFLQTTQRVDNLHAQRMIEILRA